MNFVEDSRKNSKLVINERQQNSEATIQLFLHTLNSRSYRITPTKPLTFLNLGLRRFVFSTLNVLLRVICHEKIVLYINRSSVDTIPINQSLVKLNNNFSTRPKSENS